MSLQLLVYVEKDDHRGDEIHRFSSRKQVQVGATVSAAVTVAEQLGSRNQNGFLTSDLNRLSRTFKEKLKHETFNCKREEEEPTQCLTLANS